MADEIPSIDAAEVAALEREAERQHEDGLAESREIRRPEPVRASVAPSVTSPSQAGRQPDPPPTLPCPEPKGVLELLVEQAIYEQTKDLRKDLEDLKRWLRHTMHLTMVLAHVLRVSPEEVDAASRKVDAADQQIRKEP